jgi:D-xylose transport system ATP-binding protein
MTPESTAPFSDASASEGARSASADRAPGALAADGARADAANRESPLLALRGVSKHFGPVQALSGVDLDILAGEVIALAGDNGAGKSVLIKTISGIWQPDDGETLWEGKPVHIHTPKDAAALGIATVYQDLALCDNLDIVQNVYLGRELAPLGVLDETAMEITAKSTLSSLSVTSVRSIRQPVGSLSGGQRQAVAVARAVMFTARLVIMDEPTAALGVAQTAMVLDLIRQLSSNGIAVIVISHNLNDVFAVADRVGSTSDYDRQSVVELMTTGLYSGAVATEADASTSALEG